MKLYSPLWLLSAITFGLANQLAGQVYNVYTTDYTVLDTWVPDFSTSNGPPAPSLIYPTGVSLDESGWRYSYASITIVASAMLIPQHVFYDNFASYDETKYRVVYDKTVIHPNHWELFATDITYVYMPDIKGVSLQTGEPVKAIPFYSYVSKYEEAEITNWRTVYYRLEPIPEPEECAAVFGASVVGMAIFLRRRNRAL